MGVHRRAAEGFGRAAAAYERGRPGYPQAAIDWMVERLRITPAATVVDLGAGTGKFSRMMHAAGARVIAIEPVAAMRAELASAVPGVAVLDGTAEAIPPRRRAAIPPRADGRPRRPGGPRSVDQLHRDLARRRAHSRRRPGQKAGESAADQAALPD